METVAFSMLTWIAILAWLLLIRLAVGAPTRPEQWLARAVARHRGQHRFTTRR